jgi:hypothetical protein
MICKPFLVCSSCCSLHVVVMLSKQMIWIPYPACSSSAVSVHVHQGSTVYTQRILISFSLSAFNLKRTFTNLLQVGGDIFPNVLLMLSVSNNSLPSLTKVLSILLTIYTSCVFRISCPFTVTAKSVYSTNTNPIELHSFLHQLGAPESLHRIISTSLV